MNKGWEKKRIVQISGVAKVIFEIRQPLCHAPIGFILEPKDFENRQFGVKSPYLVTLVQTTYWNFINKRIFILTLFCQDLPTGLFREMYGHWSGITSQDLCAPSITRIECAHLGAELAARLWSRNKVMQIFVMYNRSVVTVSSKRNKWYKENWDSISNPKIRNFINSKLYQFRFRGKNVF